MREIRQVTIAEFQYAIYIWWSEEDGGFIADVPELQYCSAYGDTREAAVVSCQEAIAAWLEVARDLGRPIPEPGSCSLGSTEVT